MFRHADHDGLDIEALFNASPNAYVLLDPELVIRGCNDAYLDAVGVSDRAEIIGRGMFDAFPSDPRSESHRLLRTSLERVVHTHEADHIALIPYAIPDPDGTMRMRYWSATHTPVFDGDGVFRYIMQHTVDVSELKALRAGGGASIAEAGLLHRAQAVQAENLAMLAEAEWMRGLFQQAPGFVAILSGPEHVFQLSNHAYEQLVGRDDLVGRPLREALPEVVEQGFLALLDAVYRTGEVYIGRGVAAELRVAGSDATELHYLDFVYQPIRDAAGAVSGIFVQGNDITAERRAQIEVARQAEFLRLAQEGGGFGTFDWDLASDRMQVSPTFRTLYGLPPGDAPLSSAEVVGHVHPEDHERLATAPHERLEDALVPTEYRVRSGDGERWVARQGIVLRDAAGRAVRVLGAVHDITQRKQFEQQLETLAHESAHRVKNLLAMVQAIVAQTLRRADDMDSAAQAVTERLAALARGQSLLAQGASAGRDIATLVAEVAALHGGPARIRAQGDAVRLDERTALGAGLVLHELSTNATKYGALSSDAGHVAVHWTVDADDGALHLEWRETGGPAVVAPQRRGFGSTLIERSLATRPGNRVTLDYAPDGLVCRWRLALGGCERGFRGRPVLLGAEACRAAIPASCATWRSVRSSTRRSWRRSTGSAAPAPSARGRR